MKKFINQIDVYKNINNINGFFSINNVKYFFKILKENEFSMEKQGYRILKKYYNVSKMLGYDKKNNLVIYEFNKINQDDKGLLADYFREREAIDSDFSKTFTNYRDVLNNTIKKVKKGNCRIFFEDRLDTRFERNFNNKIVSKIDGKKFYINNNEVLINNKNIKNQIYNFFKNLDKEWCIISNADPTELNLCIDGSIFDYTAGGYVPLMCEFATFSWYTLIQGEYFSLKYNEKSLKNHRKMLNMMNKVFMKNNYIFHNIRKIRYEAVESYAKEIIEPILKKIDYDNWYNDYKNYFSMKLMAVFLFDEFDEKDIILTLGYLNLLYNAKINSIDQLLNLLKKIFLGGIYE